MTEGWRKRQIQMQITMDDDDIQEYAHPCPSCEYNKQRAQLWRDEAYKHAGHPLPDRGWVGLTELEKAEITSLKWWDWEDTFDIDGFIKAIEAKLKEKNNGA
jgi:hypothetical protein